MRSHNRIRIAQSQSGRLWLIFGTLAHRLEELLWVSKLDAPLSDADARAVEYEAAMPTDLTRIA